MLKRLKRTNSPKAIRPNPEQRPGEIEGNANRSGPGEVGLVRKSAAQKTVELLSSVEPDDVLQLMLPRLLKEREERLAEIDQELAAIDKRLGELQHRRDDALQVDTASFENPERLSY